MGTKKKYDENVPLADLETNRADALEYTSRFKPTEKTFYLSDIQPKNQIDNSQAIQNRADALEYTSRFKPTEKTFYSSDNQIGNPPSVQNNIVDSSLADQNRYAMAEYAGRFKPTPQTFYNSYLQRQGNDTGPYIARRPIPPMDSQPIAGENEVVRKKITGDNPTIKQPYIYKSDENNLFGYPYTHNNGKSAFYQWKDKNVQGNLAKMGDPNGFNSLGNGQNTRRPDDYVVRGKIPALPQSPQQSVATQPQPQQSLSGLNPNAAKLNGNPDTTGWAGSDIAKANHFSTFGNKWNPSMNTPGLTSFDIAKPQAVQQPPSLKTIQNTQPSQNAQVIRNGQLLNQSFTSDGNGGYNSRMYDAAGNELTRADQEQMRLMASAQRLIDHSMPAQNASSQYANEQAVRALNALSGLKGIPTTSDIQKDSAAIRKMDMETELAPKLAKAEIGLRGAQANMYDTQNQYAAKEYGLKKMGVESTAKYHDALAEQALRGKPENPIEQQRLNLDRQIAAAKEYDMIVGSSPNMPEPQKNKLKRELEVKYGLKQRRSATEFQN